MNKITDSNHDACVKILNEVFDNFDFDRVKKTMDALDWTWANIGEENAAQARRVPTLDEIKSTAAKLMWDCANEDVDVVSSGGFRVEKDFEDGDDPWMRLSFEVSDFDVCYSDIA